MASQLPERGTELTLTFESVDGFTCEDRSVVVLAVDVDEAIWTVKDVRTGELLLMTFDENGNWSQIEVTIEEDGTQ